jgi:hypothetical protein
MIENKDAYPEEIRSKTDRGVYGDHEEQSDDIYMKVGNRPMGLLQKRTSLFPFLAGGEFGTIRKM